MSTIWSDEVLSDPAVLDTDENGKWVICGPCSKAKGVTTKVMTRWPYTIGRWIDHCANKQHLVDAASKKNQVAMNSFFSSKPSWKSKIKKKDRSLPEAYDKSVAKKALRSCQGVPPNPHLGELRKQLFTLTTYSAAPTKNDAGYIFGLFNNLPTLISGDCNNKGVGHPRVPGLRCMECEDFRKKKWGSIHQNIKRKHKRYQSVLDILKLPVLYASQAEVLGDFVKTNVSFFSTSGCTLHQKAKDTLLYFHESVKRTARIARSAGKKKDEATICVDSPDIFLRKFLPFYQKHKKGFADSLIGGLLQAIIAKTSGHRNVPYTVKVINFYRTLEAGCRKGLNIVSANLFGPALRSLQYQNAKTAPSAFVVTDKEQRKARLEFFIDSVLQSQPRIRYSIAIDGTKVAETLQLSTQYKAFLGGASPRDMITIGPNETMEGLKLKMEDETIPLAAEVKVCVVTFQEVPAGVCPMVILAGRPQSKNEVSSFNDDCVEMSEEVARSRPNCECVSAANDGVSSDSSFVRRRILSFLSGSSKAPALTDSNHNVKNIRYQAVIGGNEVTVIGDHCVDPGLLVVGGVAEDLYRIRDFASDLTVLKLASALTVEKLCALAATEDLASIVCTALTLYFMRSHLYGVNARSCPWQNRISYTWSSMLWITSMRGVSIITKRNMVCAALSMCFLMMRNDLPNPRYLTSEPNEHTFGMMRCHKREFTVMEMIEIVEKI